MELLLYRLPSQSLNSRELQTAANLMPEVKWRLFKKLQPFLDLFKYIYSYIGTSARLYTLLINVACVYHYNERNTLGQELKSMENLGIISKVSEPI